MPFPLVLFTNAILVVAVLPSVVRSQSQEEECAVLESLYTQAVNTTLPWPRGQCCGYAVGKNYVLCSDVGRLTQVEISRGGVKGTLPSLAGMTELELLYFPSNYLAGPIPSLATLTKLKWLDLSDNNFTGPIPSLAANTLLLQVDLYDNQLSGSLPTMTALTNLVRLDLHGNALTGSVDGILPESLTTCLLSYDDTNPGLYACANNVPIACSNSLPTLQPACPSKSTTTSASASSATSIGTLSMTTSSDTSSTSGGTVKTGGSTTTDPVALAGVIGGAVVALLAAILLVAALIMLRKRYRRNANEAVEPDSSRPDYPFLKFNSGKTENISNYDPVPSNAIDDVEFEPFDY
ncbi:hypothetical protein HDU93_009069 [Gonapodya sp. JEL0774]|nr:hypothetical protein HDU93_009069 [Gonapodya sp. JEL0774]